MSWNSVLDILMPIGTIVGIVGGFLGVLTYIKSLRKPKARLRFADGKKEITFSPQYYRAISHKYFTDSPIDCHASHAYETLLEQYNKKHEKDNEFILSFCLENIGTLQLENYRVDIEWSAGIQSTGYINGLPRRVIGNYIEPAEPNDLTFNRGKPQITFAPLDKYPLNQNDSKKFAFRFTPHGDITKIELYWHIVAKDFNKQGKFVIRLKPIVTEYDEIHFANCDRDIPEGAEKIEDLTPYIKQFEELLKQ